MNQEALNYVIEKTQELIEAPTCNAETKQDALDWLDALGTDAKRASTEKYFRELELDIMPIDRLIDFSQSEEGKAYFGAETAANIAEHAQKIKADGAKYCDCPACSAVEAILQKKDELLKG